MGLIRIVDVATLTGIVEIALGKVCTGVMGNNNELIGQIIQSGKDLEDAMSRAKSEAEKAFSDNRIYMEKYLEQPHHIEIQVFADNYKNIVSLGERECSIQRRYQKIIEETPSPFIDDNLRQELSNTALNITKSCNYTGAGTVEFLIDKHNNYYFSMLLMYPRLEKYIHR